MHFFQFVLIFVALWCSTNKPFHGDLEPVHVLERQEAHKRSKMGDSQNWSSFEDEKPKKPSISSTKTLVNNPENVSEVPKNPFDMRVLQQRLIFGGLVGFCTGATFGASKCSFY